MQREIEGNVMRYVEKSQSHYKAASCDQMVTFCEQDLNHVNSNSLSLFLTPSDVGVTLPVQEADLC